MMYNDSNILTKDFKNFWNCCGPLTPTYLGKGSKPKIFITLNKCIFTLGLKSGRTLQERLKRKVGLLRHNLHMFLKTFELRV